MTNYLVLGSDGQLGGYERADILLCDLATHDEPQAIWRRTGGLQCQFAPSSVDEIRVDMEASANDYRERYVDVLTGQPDAANICGECGGRNGHASPFCRLVDLTEAVIA